MPAMHTPPTPPHLCWNDDFVASLERATLDAVAPQAWREWEGWLLPFDTSTIGRATSAVPLRHHGLDAAAVAAIARQYAQRQLRPAFRVADVPGLAPVQAALQRLGFRAEQPTLVQTGSVTALRAACTAAPAPVTPAPDAAWAAVYTAPGFDPVDGAHRVQALSRSHHAVYASLSENHLPLAAGTAAFSQGWASIHGMRTVPSARGRGLATRILGGLADAALARGLTRVFLQVEEGNQTALALYQRAGLATAWRYHYWRQP